MSKEVQIVGKVISDGIFFKPTNRYEKGRMVYEKLDAETVVINKCGTKYQLLPNGMFKGFYRGYEYFGFEEIEIKKVADGLYHLHFYSVSYPGIENNKPFLVIELTKEQVVDWYNSDFLFREERTYIVRRSGKKFYGQGNDRRCIECRYLVGNDTECSNCKKKSVGA